MLLQTLAKNWWLLLLRGLVAILFGLLALTWPGISLLILITVYGVYALADGLFALTAAFRHGAVAPRWWLIFIGLVGLTAGMLVLSRPIATAIILLTFVGIWCIVRGVLELIGAFQLRREIDDEWTLVVHGIISVIFGGLVLAWPAFGALAVLWGIGVYAIVAGFLLIGFALRLRRCLPGGA